MIAPKARLAGLDWRDNPYGSFDQATGAFVVRDPLTPRPWVNVMANEDYGLVISQKGGGFSWYKNCQLGRLTRWDQDLAADDQGRFFFVRDTDTGETFSTTFQPVRSRPVEETIEHGLGYTTFNRKFAGLELEHTVFVPRAEACELWLVTLRNTSSRVRNLRLASYLEWHFGGPGEWHREFHRLFMESRTVGDTLLAWKHRGLVEGARRSEREQGWAFASLKGPCAVDWVTDKATFVGRAGDLGDPEALASPPCVERAARWDDPIAAALCEVSLAPGEEIKVLATIGAADTEEAALALANRFDARSAQDELRATREHWERRCRSANAQTPDEALNVMLNAWLPYQAIAGRMVARCAYYQQGGAYGFRDQLQDSLMLLASEPESTLEQLGRHAEVMACDGSVLHWWHPGADIGVPSHHSDTCLWLAYGTLAYLDETDHLAALEQPYRYRKGENGCEVRSGSLFEHCLRGIRRALDRRSPRGLPLLGAGDWNDGLSHAGIEGRGESVWMAMFLYDILQRWQPYLARIGDPGLATEFNETAAELQDAVEKHAWDGEWYIAGTRDDGRPFGSRECAEGRIFLNPQTWAQISGIASPERARRAMDSVREHLIKPYGALLLSPAYSQVDPYIGYLSRYAPGLRENGGVYSHASTWAVQALALEGRCEESYALLSGMLPPSRSAEDPDLYAAEPYVMPGNADGPDSPFEGRAGWTWYTGSAAWLRRIAHEWILGVRSTSEGLWIRPQVPAEWDEVRIVRPYRGGVYDITLKRGFEGVRIGGASVPLPLPAPAGRVAVEVGLG